jgi:GT2 family glycosyltransferase
VTEPVSVALPVRDEAHRVAPTLAALLAQRGVADLELLVLDDGSTDGTGDFVRRVAGGDPRLRLLRGTPPPRGLPGKPHACAQLAAAARGSVLVFVDADVTLAPHAVAAAVAVLRGAGLDLLSPWPRQLADGAARLVQPLLQWSWMVSLPLRRAERSAQPALCAANGQFLVVDAAALARAGGFAGVAAEVLDDLAVARAVKRSGGRVGVADGADLAARSCCSRRASTGRACGARSCSSPRNVPTSSPDGADGWRCCRSSRSPRCSCSRCWPPGRWSPRSTSPGEAGWCSAS